MPRIRFIRCAACRIPLNRPGVDVRSLDAESRRLTAGVLCEDGFYRCMMHERNKARGQVMLSRANSLFIRQSDVEKMGNAEVRCEDPRLVIYSADGGAGLWQMADGSLKRSLRRPAVESGAVSRGPSNRGRVRLTAIQCRALAAILDGSTSKADSQALVKLVSGENECGR